mmetsp:Transcript_35007/g.57174  ORF Transcript_35007/g.57174 Transcript_35007/m.57174 type:complete len:203 (+) Transcript_35007:107-715(+)
MLNLIFVSLAILFIAARSQISPTPRPTSPPTEPCDCNAYIFDASDYNSSASDVNSFGTGCTQCSYDSLISCTSNVCTCPTLDDCVWYDDWNNAIGGVVAATGAALGCFCCCCIVFAVVSGLGCVGGIIAIVVLASQSGKKKTVIVNNPAPNSAQAGVQMNQSGAEGPATASGQTVTQQPAPQYVDQNGNPVQVVIVQQPPPQ